jgi:adenosylhomocysteine nucleosidase
MSKIAIIAALPGELKPLVRGWQRPEPNLWTGTIAGREAIAVAGGMGAEAATRAVARANTKAEIDTLISYGWAGALSCAVKPPSVFTITEIVDARTGERFTTDIPSGQRLVTLDHVARSDEKRRLAETYQSVLVDMEAATVARLATARNLAFYCFKGISDAYTDRLPDFAPFIDDRGEFRTAAFVTYAALHPAYWGALRRLGQMSSLAASELASFVPQSLKQAL